MVTGDGDDVRVSWQGVSIAVEDPAMRKVLVTIRTKEAELAAETMATDEEATAGGDGVAPGAPADEAEGEDAA